MKNNRWLALLLAALIPVAGIAEQLPASADHAEQMAYAGQMNAENALVVGHTTQMSGRFTTQLWGNNTADLDVNALINGYNLVQWNWGQKSFEIDPTVVSGLTVYDDAAGNRTYLMALYDDLSYSDGTAITAYDYAFSMLFTLSKEVKSLGGQTDNYQAILGAAAYQRGEAPTLAGVKVMSPQMLSVTISADYLPFFYEMGQLLCHPMPIHVIAPQCQVRDDGNGVYIAGSFTEALLQETMFNETTGYLSHPSVVSGPYCLTSYDGVTAEFAINPYFKGNEQGYRPSISRLTFTLADNDTAMDKLASGELGLINKALRKDMIDEGLELAGRGIIAKESYERLGQSFISFRCDQPALQSQAVRQAIALCLDKDQLVEDYTGSYGVRVDGYYGVGQWMTRLLKDQQTSGNTAEQSAAFSLDQMRVYDLNVEEAVRLLNADGWQLDPSTGIRCKQVDGQVLSLDLTLLYPAGNQIADSLDDAFVDHLKTAGIRLSLQPVPMTDLLDIYYRTKQSDCDMIYLATNFDVVFDPASQFDPNQAANSLTPTGLADEKLYQLALDLRRTAPGDTYAYMTKWIAFQEHFAQVLPLIPVYSNVYYDFYTPYLQAYDISENTTWTQAIVEAAYMSDPVADMLH